jgi:hypothetical protein
MKKYLFLFFLVAFVQAGNAQYWFGPKVGINYTNAVYQDPAIEGELYDVANDFDFHFGLALNYTATDLYSVYTELIYEKTDRHLVNKPSNLASVTSNITNKFITIPVMLRVSLGRLPFHYYVNGGPKISYWLASKGDIYLPSFEESVILDPVTGAAIEPGPVNYKVTFNSSKANGEDVYYMRDPNRLQFGLTGGAGARLMIDFRYTFGHSNLGFDTEADSFDYPDDFYVDSFEYTTNTLSVSIGYLFGYNAQFRRKGRSTDKESNNKKK